MQQPRNNETSQGKLAKLAKHIGNTTELLLKIAKSALRNGDKLFNSNLVLRQYVSNDINVANLKIAFQEKVPSLTRDIEIVENIINKYRMAAGLENKAKIDQYYEQLDSIIKEAENYAAQRESLKKQIDTFIKQHPKNIQEMIDNMK